MVLRFVARDGPPVALPDRTSAGPIDRLDEIAGAARWDAQPYDDVAERVGRPARPPTPGGCASSSTSLTATGRPPPSGGAGYQDEFAVHDRARASG
nr:MAG: hypothetical protein DIU60_14110 [Actinomycetota bacterium]